MVIAEESKANMKQGIAGLINSRIEDTGSTAIIGAE